MAKEGLCIKVPVYLTTPQVLDSDEMFGGTKPEMIQNLKNLLDGFEQVTKNTRNKTKRTVIKEISYQDCEIKSDPALLLKINAYSTNMNDGYFESTGQREELGVTGKVGSDTNYVLMYPQINGIHPDSRSCSYLMLVYEDPTKDQGSVSHLAKTVAKEVLHQPVQHIKPESVMEAIKRIGTLPELQITYVGVSYDDDGDAKYSRYRTSVKTKSSKEETYANVPSEEVEKLANQLIDTTRFQKRIVRLIHGKRVYKLKKDFSSSLTEAKEALEETAEMVFNMSTSVTEDELKTKIHSPEFIIEKLSGVLDNVLNYAD